MSHSLIRAGYVDSITVDVIVCTMDQSINYVFTCLYAVYL